MLPSTGSTHDHRGLIVVLGLEKGVQCIGRRWVAFGFIVCFILFVSGVTAALYPYLHGNLSQQRYLERQ